MKRFQFSLNTVLSYKQQVLEELQNEHGQLLYQVRQQELVLQAAEERYRGLNLEFRQAETEGLTIAEALRYESGLRFLEGEIQRGGQAPAGVRGRSGGEAQAGCGRPAGYRLPGKAQGQEVGGLSEAGAEGRGTAD